MLRLVPLLLAVIILTLMVLYFRPSEPSVATHGSIYVAPSQLGGRGVFAAKSFATGETIEVCPTLHEHGEKWGAATSDYVFGGNQHPEHSVLALGYGSLYNHSHMPNAEHVLSAEDQVMTYIAKKDIRVGEEITIDYGSEWWQSRQYEQN